MTYYSPSMEYHSILAALGGEEAYLEWASTRAAQTMLGQAFGSTAWAAVFWCQRPELDEGLKRATIEAMELGSFDCVQRYIRNYAYPTADSEPPQSSQSVAAPRADLASSFKDPYIGTAVQGLYEYLTDCDKRFHQPDVEIYGKFCSIVQSSGTGKSRTIVELMRSMVLGVYINLRPLHDKNSYPPRDDIPAQILTESLPISAQEYSDRCVALFAAIFTVVRLQLCPISESETQYSKKILDWSSKMGDFESGFRESFFHEVGREYKKFSKDIQAAAPPIGHKPLESRIEDLAITEAGKDPHTCSPPVAPLMKISSSGGSDGSKGSKENEVTDSPQLRGESILREAYGQLIQALNAFFGDPCPEPKLVIAFDEAHMLGEPQNYFRPSHILCRVISGVSRMQPDVSNWVIFASTTSRVADFSAPAHIHPSLRIRFGGADLFAPYSELSWDQLATPLRDINLRNVARLEYIMGFGRPLWKSIAPSLGTVNGVLDTACAKLCNSTSFAPLDPSQAFAVLAQRFCLDICFGHSNATAFQQKAISSHLRICLETTDDRVWQDTLYPSEPLLSCAAARLLHDKDLSGDAGSKLGHSIYCLKLNMQNGLIEMGKRGELVSRILYLVAKDLLVRNTKAHSNPGNRLGIATHDRWTDEELLDCKPVPVMDYLAFMFGPAVREKAGNVFEDWYINFSHWVHMTDNISHKETNTPMHIWLTRQWVRSCAMQCCHNQPIIDKVIPMYKFNSKADTTPCLSYVFISDRARIQPTQPDLNSITPSNMNIANLGHPYIAILADLRISTKSPTFKLTNEKESEALRIYAPGINSSTYPWLKTTPPSFAEDLRAILDITKSHVPGPTRLSLRKRFQYGQTMASEFADWET